MDMAKLEQLFKEITPQWHKPTGFSGEDVEDPDSRKIPALRLVAFRPGSWCCKWLNEHGVSTIDQLLAIQEQGAPCGVWRDLSELQKKYSFGHMWNTCVDAKSVGSLVEYVLAAWKAFLDPDPKKLYVITSSMGLGNNEKRMAGASVANDIGLTGDRARAAVSAKEKSIRERLFGKAHRRETFEDFCLAVDEELKGRKGLISTEVLVAAIDRRFGWTGTTVWSLYCLLSEVGYKVDRVPNVAGVSETFQFASQRDLDRADQFLELVCAAHDADSMSYNRMRAAFIARGVEELSVDEYNACADSLLTSGDLPSITRGYLKLARNGNAGGAAINRGILRKVFADAQRAGRKCLLLPELIERCGKYDSGKNWDSACRSLLGNQGGYLDDNESFFFQYGYVDNGKRGKSPTGYALSDYVLNDQVRTGLRNMVADIKTCLQESGYRVMGVHGAWKRHFQELDGLPYMGVFFLSRGLREFSGDLHFHDSKDMRFCISLPKEKDVTINLLAYETWKYFSALHRERATIKEISRFLSGELQYELNSGEISWLKKDATNQYLIEEPTETGK